MCLFELSTALFTGVRTIQALLIDDPTLTTRKGLLYLLLEQGLSIYLYIHCTTRLIDSHVFRGCIFSVSAILISYQDPLNSDISQHSNLPHHCSFRCRPRKLPSNITY